MKIHDCKQGSAEWLAARLGVVTASEMDALITPLWKVRTGEGPDTYLYRKLAEKLLNWSGDDFGSFEMGQGELVEKIARPWYAFTHDVNIETPGFITSDDGKIGCSPDGLIGDDCGLEIKCPQPPTALKYLINGELPPQYRAQVHFSMLVTGRPKWVFLSYSRQFPPLEITVERDPKIDTALCLALEMFFSKFDPIYKRIKGEQDAENALKQSAYEAEIAKYKST